MRTLTVLSNFFIEQSGSTMMCFGSLNHPPSVLIHFHSLKQTTVASTHYLSTLACYQSLCSYLRPITLDLLLSGLLLINGQLTDPHMPRIHCFVWGVERARLKPILRFISRIFLLSIQAAWPTGFHSQTGC